MESADHATAGSPGRRPEVLALVGLALVVGVCLLVVWAATAGPDAVFEGRRATTHQITPTERPADPASTSAWQGRADPRDRPPTRSDSPLALLLAAVVWAGLGVLATGAAWLLWRLLRMLVRSERPELPLPQVDIEVLPGTAPVATVAAGTRAALRVLGEGSPRNAIVACWRELETHVTRAGIVIRTWETPAEFVLRVLDQEPVDAGAVARLADLYREARFSTHDLGEPAREQARAALEAIEVGLLAVTAGGGAE